MKTVNEAFVQLGMLCHEFQVSQTSDARTAACDRIVLAIKQDRADAQVELREACEKVTRHTFVYESVRRCRNCNNSIPHDMAGLPKGVGCFVGMAEAALANAVPAEKPETDDGGDA